MSSIEKITFFIEECRYLGVPVLGPDLNESETVFGVNKKGQIRFGLGAIKGFGEAAVNAIMAEREKGYFKNAFELAERVDAVSKKAIECLAYSGALDFDENIHRAQYFHISPQDGVPNIEKIIRYRENKKKLASSTGSSLWGGGSDKKEELALPKLAECDKWTDMEKLNKEKEVIGFFLSGHPLDRYKLEIKSHCNADCVSIGESRYQGREVAVAGMLADVTHRTTKNGKPFAMFSLEDYSGSYKMALFGEEYLKHKHLLAAGQFVFVKGKMEERYNEKGSWEYRPKIMQLLAEMQIKQFSELRLKMDIRNLTRELIADLQDLFERNKGNQRLKINLFDADEKIDFDVFSEKYKVNASAELISTLEQMHIQAMPV
jgi:DNA polymerase-3 subunit alpha